MFARVRKIGEIHVPEGYAKNGMVPFSWLDRARQTEVLRGEAPTSSHSSATVIAITSARDFEIRKND
jgi:hypothetical protein